MTAEPGLAVRTGTKGAVAQSVVRLLGEATITPAGRLSTKEASSTGEGLAELSRVKVKVARLPSGEVLGEKLLENPGSSVVTVRSAVAVPLLPAEEVRSPVVLVWTPTLVLVTKTLMVQVLEAPRLPPETVTLAPPLVAVRVGSPQVEVGLAGVARVTPAGRLSTKATLETGLPPAVLSTVKVRELTLPGPIAAGEKAFVKVGWATSGPAKVRKTDASVIARGFALLDLEVIQVIASIQVVALIPVIVAIQSVEIYRSYR
jgi:hypothetical protein